MIFLLVIFNLIIFLPIFKGLVPLPTDALVGAYYPWLGQVWGFATGVPFKNIALTDVFSQLYPWRSLAMDLIRQGVVPLWNQYSASGSPLLANWQSAPFYPLNVFMLIFGNIKGYSILVFLQPVLSSIFMYLYLKEIKLSKAASFFGALVFSYSGFMVTYLEYATIGQIMLWLPLILLFFERYFETRKISYLSFASLCFFPVLTGGFFQPAFYLILITSAYWFSRCLLEEKNKIKLIILGMFFIVLGITLSSIQLLPTAELLKYSIRNLDHNIVEYNYGLLPIKNLVTFLAPDFFGNPVTSNYWGVVQYQEVTGYFSSIAFILAVSSFFLKKRDWRLNIFTLLFIGSIIFAFENPVSKLVYQFKFPLLSTGYASRWLIVTSFTGAFLSAFAIEKINIKKYGIALFITFGLLAINYFCLHQKTFAISQENSLVASRNLILPLGILFLGTLSVILIKNRNLAIWAIVAITAFDLGRFTIKFTPFSKPEYSEKSLPVFEYINQNSNIGRVITQEGPILPANSWLYPKVYSPAGYDPLFIKDYVTFFHSLNGNDFNNGIYTRYLALNRLDSPLLDLINVKYLMAVKYDQYGKIRPWGKLDESKIDMKKYKPVFTDVETVILENSTVLPRAILFYKGETEKDPMKAAEKLANGFDYKNLLLLDSDNVREFKKDKDDSVEITKYSSNSIDIKVNTRDGAYLFLSDTFYPGWEARVNGKKTKIIKADTTFRAIEIQGGERLVQFEYKPKSFIYGVYLSIISITTLGVITLFYSRKFVKP